MELSRRAFIGSVTGAGVAALAAGAEKFDLSTGSPRIPVIDITDLYHAPQDPGDNVDLIAAYALPEVDLRAVIFDVTDRYRRPFVNPEDHSHDDPAGGRDPGFLPVWQLNYLFGRDIPCAAAPFTPMRSPEDPMTDAPAFQQQGIALLVRMLRESAAPVEIVSFGSARPLAVAFNRYPNLLREKVREIYLCAGSAPDGFQEWNVYLDPHAFVRVLRSGLPITLYPCATDINAFDLGRYNTFWKLPDFSLIQGVAPPLQRYLAYAMERSNRVDFLSVLEEEVSDERLATLAARPHNVWETDVWMHVARRKLMHRAGMGYRILPEAALLPGDTLISSERLPCALSVRDDGQFTFSPTDQPTPYKIFYRADPEKHQQALREALPELYATFMRERPA